VLEKEITTLFRMPKIVVMFIVFGVSWSISNYFSIHGFVTSRHIEFQRLLSHVCARVCFFFYFDGIHHLVLRFTDSKLENSVTHCNFIIFGMFRSHFDHLQASTLLLDVY